MAIVKTLTQASGATAQYHKIGMFRGVIGYSMELTVKHYKDEDYRKQESPPVWEDYHVFPWEAWKDYVEKPIGECLYTLIKSLPQYEEAEDSIDIPEPLVEISDELSELYIPIM